MRRFGHGRLAQLVRASALQAEGPRFEPATAHHAIRFASTVPAFSWPPQLLFLHQNCSKIRLIHAERRLAVTLKNARILLPQHLNDEMVGGTTRAQPGCERVAQLVQREIGHTSALQRFSPNVLQIGNVRF